jgi:hypothetical protein
MIPTHDRNVLRDLAKRLAEIAHLPVMAERRALWVAHNQLQRGRPPVLVFPEGAWRELLPPEALACTSEESREMEARLRRDIYSYEHLHDDKPIDGIWEVGPVASGASRLDWGLQPRVSAKTQETGSFAFDPVLHDERDLEALRYPTVVYDPDATARRLAEAEDLFGDILPVERRGVRRISFHLTNLYAYLRGLDQFMWDIHDHPRMVHRAMAFFEEGYRRYVQQLVDLGLLDTNNDGTYHSSGGVGYTTELPGPDYDPDHVLPHNLWASAESQEMAQVSPAAHEEFVMQYERRLLAPFGLNGYGCCEDLTHKLDRVKAIPNMRRISISPFADVAACAEQLGADYIFSWKPNPAYLVGDFDPDQIRTYVREALDAARGCVLEIILKDTHTCEHHPERFTAWTDVVRELVEEC